MITDIADILAEPEGDLPDGLSATDWHRRALLSCSEMARIDQASLAAGIPGFALMEAAGKHVADTVQSCFPTGRIAVLCGPGNNGGDGFIAASRLKALGRDVVVGVVSAASKQTGDAAKAATVWDGETHALSPALLEGCEIVVDALFGAGLSRAPEGKIAETLAAMGSRKVVAVDMPSGISGDHGRAHDTALRQADVTVTFFKPKTGHYLLPGRSRCGRLYVADIGIPQTATEHITPAVALNSPDLWRHALPTLSPDSHKYSRGTVFVTGGPEMIGAACLVTRAAQRAGAGLVRIAAPVQQSPLYKLALESAVVHGVKDTRRYLDLLDDKRIGCAVIGPGLGLDTPGAQEKTLAVLRSALPAVLDADALTLLVNDPQPIIEAGKRGRLLLTPHEGEFARLFPDLAKLTSKCDRALAAAERVGSPVLLKGYDTVIAAPSGHAVINANAPESLATAGAGDVLCGIAAALIAGKMPVFAAACAAAYLHAEAANRFGFGLIASDLPDLLPTILGDIHRPSDV